MPKGSIVIVLHAHLPYVKHPDHINFLEEDWLFEAITESYIPLIKVMQRLIADRVDFRLCLSVSPPLCEMLADKLLQSKYKKWLDLRIELMRKELQRHVSGSPFRKATEVCERLFKEADEFFKGYNGDLISRLRDIFNSGYVESICSTATHAVLPLLINSEAVKAQVSIGVRSHMHHFGIKPEGIWLPECAYDQSLNDVIEQQGLRYFFLDSHALDQFNQRVGLTETGLVVFSRDEKVSRQIWSATEGYPGDFWYREFYRDLGFDADWEYIKSYIPDGIRRGLGIKYYRITGKVGLDQKMPYDPQEAFSRLQDHSRDFTRKIISRVESLADQGSDPVIVIPFDAELFGHWWFEGPSFLELFLRQIETHSQIVKTALPKELLNKMIDPRVITPHASSWGDRGYFDTWVNPSNDWVWRHIHIAQLRIKELAKKYPATDGLKRRALNQALRELLLMQSSDWPFMMSTNRHPDYARNRFIAHVDNFTSLYNWLIRDEISEEQLTKMERQNSLFSHIDYRIFAQEKL